MRDPMYFENYGTALDFEVANKGEKVLVPNYLVNVLSAIVVLATCVTVVGVGVASFRAAKGEHVGTLEASTAVLLPDANDALDHRMAEEWRTYMPSPRPILCFLNREGFLRPPPDTFILREFPGFYCNEIVYNGMAFDSATLHLLADATDDAIIYQLNRVRKALYPHWRIVLNVFVDGYTTKKMQDGQTELMDLLFSWLERRRGVDGINFEFADDAFLGDIDASSEVPSFFASVKADQRWGNRTLSAMMPYAATVLLLDELSLTIDRILVKTHGLMDESSATTQLTAPLDYAGLAHRRSNHRTVMGILEELDENLGRKTCFTVALSGTVFTLKSPSECDVGDPVIPRRPGKASFSNVCEDAPNRVKKIEDDVAYTSENYTWVSHEDQFTVFEKTAKVLRHWNVLCVAVVDVDLDDVRGQCGRSYPLLRRIYETSYMLKYSPE
ncbi:hypothetical protein HPB52_006343 [Rhipicephalus sanguineus]|uniref:GH18 domain-containing protein n=1 Tax=Rhipicephalus sanguineus TaxID=34632 RepID=A0A9D4PH92_RHISA|nr:hypothetical protein HPB52_006343 [Rhipicephalus sanguineus]